MGSVLILIVLMVSVSIAFYQTVKVKEVEQELHLEREATSYLHRTLDTYRKEKLSNQSKLYWSVDMLIRLGYSEVYNTKLGKGVVHKKGGWYYLQYLENGELKLYEYCYSDPEELLDELLL